MTQRLRLFRPWQLLVMAGVYALFNACSLFAFVAWGSGLAEIGTYPPGAVFDLIVLIIAPVVALIALPLLAWHTCRERRDWFLFLLLVLAVSTALFAVNAFLGSGFAILVDPNFYE